MQSWALMAATALGPAMGCGSGEGDEGTESAQESTHDALNEAPGDIEEALTRSQNAAARPCGPGTRSPWPPSAIRPFARQFNAAPSPDPTRLNALALDPTESVLLAGQLGGAVNFDGHVLTSAGDLDALVAKLDPCGAPVWARAFGDGATQTAMDIGADAAGNVIVMGAFNGTIDLGTGPLTSRGFPRDVFVAKLDRRGVALWVKHVFAEEGGMSPTAIAVDRAGNTLLLGSLEGKVSFGDGTIASGTVTAFVIKLDPAGNAAQSALLGTSTDQEPIDIEVDRLGNAFVAGHDARGYGVFALALDPAAAILWRQSFRAPRQYDEVLEDLDVNRAGRPLIVGRGFLGQGADPGDDPSYFAAALGDAGAIRWIERRDEPMVRVAASTFGTALVAGTHCKSRAGSGSLTCNLILTRLRALGDERQEHHYQGSATVAALESDLQGRAVIAGNFKGALDLGPWSLRSPAGALFVARMPR
jgi:hypothetical protein